MSKIIFATAFNQGYYDTAFDYLNDISRHSRLDNRVVTLDYEQEHTLPNLRYHRLDSGTLKLPLNNWCIQHGEFLDAIPGKPEDVILFTDADIRMQREMTRDEVRTLRELGPGEVFVGFNAGPTDTLMKEASRLRPLVNLRDLLVPFYNLNSPCYNVGVMACQRRVWEQICDHYVKMYPKVQKFFGHVASQQWLISWLVWNLFEVVEMPQSFHSHGHYGMPQGCFYIGAPDAHPQNKILMSGDVPVLLRHKL